MTVTAPLAIGAHSGPSTGAKDQVARAAGAQGVGESPRSGASRYVYPRSEREQASSIARPVAPVVNRAERGPTTLRCGAVRGGRGPVAYRILHLRRPVREALVSYVSGDIRRGFKCPR